VEFILSVIAAHQPERSSDDEDYYQEFISFWGVLVQDDITKDKVEN
jgi:hypothetical protein